MFEGVITAMVTPFSGDRIDEMGFCQNLEHQLDAGVDALVVLGTTGEAPTLSYKEKERLVSLAVEKANVPVIVGTGTYSTQETIEQTKWAKKMGANAALVISPYYNKPSQEGLYRHFAKVAEESDFPIILYNHPGRTGVNLEIPTLKRLFEIPQIVSIKEASGSLSFMQEVIEVAKGEVLQGVDEFTAQAVAMGAKGVVSVLSNLLPGAMKLLLRVASEGDYERIEEISEKLRPYFEASVLEINPVPIKAMMECAGLAAGGVRLPLCSLEEKNWKTIESLVKLQERGVLI